MAQADTSAVRTDQRRLSTLARLLPVWIGLAMIGGLVDVSLSGARRWFAAGQGVDAVRPIRDEIRSRVLTELGELGVERVA